MRQKQRQQKILRWDLLRNSILNQVILIATVFITIAIILVSMSLAEMKRSSENISSAVSTSFGELFNHSIRSLDEIYHLYVSEENVEPVHRKRIFNVFKNSDKNIDGIYLLDRNGLYIDGTDQNILIGTDFSGLDYVKEVPKLGDAHWSTVNVSLETGIPTAFISKRYEKMIVVSRLKLDEITDYLRNYKLSDNSEICITDKNGVYIVNKDVELVLTRSFDEYIKNRKTEKITRYKGGLAIPYVSDIEADGWRVIVYQSVNDFITPALLVLFGIVSVAILLTVSINIVTYRRLKVVSEDLFQIEERAKKISGGSYDFTRFYSEYIEINTLQNTFETLIVNILSREKALEESAESVRELNESLEGLVEERTGQLMIMNNELNDAYNNLKDAQSMIVQNEKLAALGQMVSGVAHELNTPVGNAFTAATYIKATSELLNERVNSGNIKRSEFVEIVQEIHNGADIIFRNLTVASGIISNFKQIAADHQSMEWREFNIYELLKGVAISFNIDIRNANVQLDLRCPEEYFMKSYPGALVHIFSNLIRNSLLHGFTDREGGHISLDVMKYEDHFKFVFKDNGIGMDSLTLQKIYDPFYTTKRAKGGTGLGMNIVYNYITNILLGTINCDSQIGVGTTFRIELPSYVKPNSEWQLDQY